MAVKSIFGKVRKFGLTTMVGAIALSLMSPLQANEKDIADIMKHMNTIKESPQKYSKAILLGGDRVAFCAVCHGTDGKGKKEGVPVLAGQNPKYLFIQFEKFLTGHRTEPVMQSLAKNLTEQDKINIALFYSSKETAANNLSVSEDDKSAGLTIYKKQCSSCHGEDAKGHGEFPRIAGQNQAYSIKSLHAFRKKGGERENDLMRALVNKLTDEEIRQVSAFLSSIN